MGRHIKPPYPNSVGRLVPRIQPDDEISIAPTIINSLLNDSTPTIDSTSAIDTTPGPDFTDGGASGGGGVTGDW